MCAELLIDGRWTNTLRPKPVPLWEGSEYTTLDWYNNRNYTLFGVLAGVRRRTTRITSECRGIPDDIDPRTIREYVESENNDGTLMGGADGHSASWLLLSEILNWPVWVKPQDGADLLRHFVGEYEPELAEACSDFLRCMLELQKYALEVHGVGPENVRLVFDFDN